NPGMLVQLCPSKAFSIGIQVDQFTITAVACDLAGTQVWADSRQLNKRSVAATNALIFELVAVFRAQCPEFADRVLGIGVAAPGPFGGREVARLETTAFAEFGLAENIALLSTELGHPVILENDAAAAALGEYFYGKGKGLSSYVLLHFGLGFGAGLVLDGELYRGNQSNAGELGHIVIETNGKQCHCGKRGCLERYLSIFALCESLSLPPDDASSITRAEQLFKDKDPRVLAWIEANAIYLERAIDIVKATLDVEAIFIGGVVSSELIEAILNSCIAQSGSVLVAQDSFDNVYTAASGPITVALGAAAAASNATLAPSLSKMLL
ncbi:MAG: ROK family protein, partial [Pseudomonadales bacterium]|nr:ROK family protein [Pseudomonadales bacterium]